MTATKRRLGSAIVSLALLLGLLPGFAGLVAPAHAAQNDNIVLTVDSFTRIDQQGTPVPNPGKTYVGDWVELKVSFDATNADPVPGDSFTVALPPEFANIESGRPGNEIVKPLMFDNVRAGDCVIRHQEFTCTFNDEIVGKEGVKGTISARVEAIEESTRNEVPILLNGEESMVDVPGGNGIARKETKFSRNGRIAKGATGIGTASEGVNWTINIGGAWLAKNLPGKKTFTVVDTLPNDLLKVTDDLASITLHRASVESNGTNVLVATAAESKEAGYELVLEPQPDGLTTRITVVLPHEVNEEENFQIFLPTVLTSGGTIDKGWTYSNDFSVEGSDEVAHGEKTYIESFTASVSYHEGFGIFSVTKTAQGPGTLSDDQEFEILVSYDLSTAQPFVKPAGWTEPDNPFRVKIPLGAPILINPQLPAGTTVTIVEDLDKANQTATPGVRWKSPQWTPVVAAEASKFTITEDGAKVQFQIENKTNLRLNLANTNAILSTFKVAKKITGDDAAAYGDQAFNFDYVCTDGQSGTVTGVTANGSPAEVLDGAGAKKFETGTVCTITEQTPEDRAGYSLAAPDPVKVTVQNAVQAATLTNDYTRDSGKFLIAKALNANNSRGYETFDVGYECSADGYSLLKDGVAVPKVGTVKITAGQQTAVGRFPAGTTCRVTSETDQIRDGYDLAKDLGDEVTVAKDADAVATVTNTYTAQLGKFAIAKRVVANGSTGVAGETFSIDYTCTPLKRTGLQPVSGTVEVADGQSVEIGEFQVGTKCAVTGEADKERAGYVLAKDLGSEVTIVKGQTASVEVVNTYSVDYSPFEITKTVEAGGSQGSDTFSVNYECSVAGKNGVAATGSVDVTAGAPTQVGEFPVGATCAVTGENDAQRTGYTLASDLGKEVTIAKGATSQIAVKNTYVRDYAPFAVAKNLVANGSTGSDDFVLNYECSAEGSNGVAATGKVTVTAGAEKVVGEFPTGTVCAVLGEDPAPRDGYTLQDPEITGQVTVQKGTTAKVTVTNTYARDYAPFKVAKTVVDNGSTGSNAFSLNYTCSAEGKNSVAAQGKVEVIAGAEKVVGEFPTGTKCSVTSEDDAQRVGYTLATDLGSEVTLSDKGQAQTVTVTNTYTRDYAPFVITKQVVDGGSTGGTDFTVTYQCSAEGQRVAATGDVTVKAGEAKTIGNFPTGTTCSVVDEDRAAANRDGYTLGVDFGAPVSVVKGQEATATVTNTYVRQRGGFVINKTVLGDGSALAPKEFDFTYTCDQGTPVTVQVKPGVPYEVDGIGTGKCTIAEGDSTVDKTDLVTELKIAGAVSTDGAFQIEDKKTVEVEVSNTYTLHRGTFELSKKVEADLPSDEITQKKFDFSYICSDGTAGNLQASADGSSVPGPQIPLDSTCEIVEDMSSAQVADYELNAGPAQNVTITSTTEPVKVEFVNKYRRHTAGFTVAKQVEGGPFTADNFAINYVCGDVTGKIEVPGNGSAVDSGLALPTGTECRIWEDADAAKRSGYELSAPAEQKIILAKDGEKIGVTVKNTYQMIVRPSLPRTGA